MSFKRLIFSFGALALALVAAPRAQAQTCMTTADCHLGFVCVTNIAAPGPATPAPAPAQIDPTAPAKTSALVAPQSGYCQAAPCAADSECGPNMVCHTETYSQCTGGTAVACPANSDCVPMIVTPPTCTDMKVSRCAFTWQLPCNTDTDCGAGFMCTPTVGGSCSGSAGTGTATPGTTGTGTATGGGSAPSTGASAPAADIAVPVPPDQTCTTTTSFPGWCQPKATTCASNTDCPTDWTCVSQPTPDPAVSTTPMTGAAGTSGTTTSGAGVPSAALLPAGNPPPAPATMVCTSPYGYGIYGAKAADSGSGTPTSVGGTGAGGSGGTGSVPPMTPSPTHENAGNGTSASSGCAVGGGSSSLAFAALALLGLVLARRRK